MPEEYSDHLYPEALAHIRDVKRVSISNIQRKFRIGYNRAWQIVERMEKEGAVTEPEQNGARRILIF
jgi:DNA segregation ATPase FtsK/SpoIIIE-like protein